MPLVPATISVTWNSQYAGPHRVCYRIQGSGSPYTCTVPGGHPVCAGGGAPCSYDIPVTVDNETCDSITWEGYVQAACEDEASLNGRIPFLVTFNPDPEYAHYVVSCVGVNIEGFNIISGGTGYSVGDPLIINGTGTGATAEVASETGGVITSITLLTPGNNDYTLALVDATGSGNGDANITVNLASCPTFELVADGGVTPGPDVRLSIGESHSICDNTAPVLGPGLSAVEDGDCICQDCFQIEVTNSEIVPLDVSYINCNTTEVVTQSIAAGATIFLGVGPPFCNVIQDSVLLPDGVTISNSVPCV